MTRKVILDVDTGSDDAVAILMAALSPATELVACTTVWGNLGIEYTTDNTLRVLDHIGRGDIPVYRGLGKPYAPIPFTFDNGVDRSRGSIHAKHLPIPEPTSAAQPTPAVEWLVETLRSTTDRVTLVPVAPLTNIAAAITLDPRIVDAVEEVVIMGGGHAIGNVTPSAEANIWHDPVAADVVFQAGFERLVILPLDATHEAYVTAEEGERLRQTGAPAAVATADFLAQRIAGYTSTQPMDVPASAPIHDALCIAYLIDPDILSLTECNIHVDTLSPFTFGRTIFDVRNRGTRAPNGFVALHADRERFVELLFDVLAR